jgi:hypothetical protein
MGITARLNLQRSNANGRGYLTSQDKHRVRPVARVGKPLLSRSLANTTHPGLESRIKPGPLGAGRQSGAGEVHHRFNETRAVFRPTLSSVRFLVVPEAACATSYPRSSRSRPLRLISAGVQPCDSSRYHGRFFYGLRTISRPLCRLAPLHSASASYLPRLSNRVKRVREGRKSSGFSEPNRPAPSGKIPCCRSSLFRGRRFRRASDRLSESRERVGRRQRW